MRKVAVKILKRKSEKKVARYSISAIMLMISGDSMKKHIVVKQKHLYTEERNLMFEGQAFFRIQTAVFGFPTRNAAAILRSALKLRTRGFAFNGTENS